MGGDAPDQRAVDDDHRDRRRQRHAPADRRIDHGRLPGRCGSPRPSQDDAEALPLIAKKRYPGVIADIHFQPKYVFAAIDAGCAGVRVNPGNIKAFDDRVGRSRAAKTGRGSLIRIGVERRLAGQAPAREVRQGHAEALAESALWEASLFEEHDFRDIKISVKHHDPVVMVQAYRQPAAACDYPLHLGVTEARPAFQGTIKSAVAFGALLSGDQGTHPRLAVRAAGGGGQRSACRSSSR